jgi:cholesterol oxidase
VSNITQEFGTVDSAINDLPPGADAFDPHGKPYNYCERQGRCNVGCLPGARHTLNKQLMRAACGAINPKQPLQPLPPLFDNLKIKAFAEVDFIKELDGGGYEIHYDHYERRNGGRPGRKTRMRVTADKVIVAAGCVGTNEIMLRSKEKGGLAGLSDAVGLGFSTNGDYIAFMDNIVVQDKKEPVRLTRGPVTTSFAHFNTDDTGEDPTREDPERKELKLFHTLEDQGIPPAFASLAGFGLPVIRSLSKGRNKHLFVLWAIFLWVLKRGLPSVRRLLNFRKRPPTFKSEDELSSNMMCVVAMGREAAMGQFRLGGFQETSLRVQRTDNKRFHEDPVYDWGKDYPDDQNGSQGDGKPKAINIKKSLGDLARQLKRPNQKDEFTNPFLSPVAEKLKAGSITVSHPLGGCRMAENVQLGVVDEYGRVFDKRKEDQARPFYEGLYIADGSVIPTALGVNPSLTISMLALRIADKIIEEL